VRLVATGVLLEFSRRRSPVASVRRRRRPGLHARRDGLGGPPCGGCRGGFV